MKFLTSFLGTCLLFSTFALSAPTAPKLKGRSFKVDRIRRSDYVANGPAALRKAYRKFNITATSFGLDLLDFEPIPPSQLATTPAGNAAEPAEEGTVSATSVNSDAEFVSPIQVGGQTLVMDFDTGSSDLWVFNTQLSKADQQGHTIYNPAESKTFQQLNGATFNISYGDGSTAAGNVATDTVNIGGATVTKQAVELATDVSQSFIEDTSSNGLVGLAFSKLNTVQPQQQQTFFDNVKDSLDEPVMTASLKAGGVGTYEFGTIDQSKFTGQLTNVSVDSSNGFWEFNSAQFSVDNGQLQDIQQAPTAIADTGTSLMLVSPEVAQGYYEQVQGAVLSNQAGGFIFPCNAKLPTLSMAVGDNNLATVPASVVSFSEVGTNTTTGQKVCFGGIQSNEGNPFQIFGDVFLKSMFVVFDKRGPSLGLASPT